MPINLSFGKICISNGIFAKIYNSSTILHCRRDFIPFVFNHLSHFSQSLDDLEFLQIMKSWKLFHGNFYNTEIQILKGRDDKNIKCPNRRSESIICSSVQRLNRFIFIPFNEVINASIVIHVINRTPGLLLTIFQFWFSFFCFLGFFFFSFQFNWRVDAKNGAKYKRSLGSRHFSQENVEKAFADIRKGVS